MSYLNLHLRKGCDNPKYLKGVLPVLDRRLDYGGDGGVVLGPLLGSEASADFQFGLGRPQSLFGIIVRGWNGGSGEEGEDMVPELGDAFFEFVKVGGFPVLPRVNRGAFQRKPSVIGVLDCFD